MIKKLAIILITTLALTVNTYAGSDGELALEKNKSHLQISTSSNE